MEGPWGPRSPIMTQICRDKSLILVVIQYPTYGFFRFYILVMVISNKNKILHSGYFIVRDTFLSYYADRIIKWLNTKQKNAFYSGQNYERKER